MKLDLTGLLKEHTKAGTVFYRVRVAGDKTRRIRLNVTPDHPEFMEHYRAGRAGVQLEPEEPPEAKAIPRSIAWLSHKFEAHMAKRVEAGALDAGTLKQRAGFYTRLREKHGDMHMAMPRAELLKMQDDMSATPGAANNFIKAVRALYRWGIDRGFVSENPATGIAELESGSGATPWSLVDLEQYRKAHPKGSMAHLALSLFMFTSCRIGDVYRLGRGNEVFVSGVRSIRWQPGKKGSAEVTVPILPPLEAAIRAQNVIGPTYILTAYGTPFKSSNSFDTRFRKWVHEAGLEGRSSHGIRKAAGELLALNGATQYHIMAVHGHTQAKTSEVYTKGVERQKLAAQAMQKLKGMDW